MLAGFLIITSISSFCKVRIHKFVSSIIALEYFIASDVKCPVVIMTMQLLFKKSLNTVVIPYIFVSRFSCHTNNTISYLKKKDTRG